MRSRLGTRAADLFLPSVYEAAAAIVFAPLGGIASLRAATLDSLKIKRGTRVLELECGSGAFTAMLASRGAVVTAVDRSSRALQVAQRRAAGARFVRADVRGYVPESSMYDRVLVAFVLHELAPDARTSVLTAARHALAPGGLVAILDFAAASGWASAWIKAFVWALEPISARGWIAAPAESHLRAAGLDPVEQAVLARGGAQLVLAASHNRGP